MTSTAATRAALQTALAAGDTVFVSETAGLPGSASEGLPGELLAVPAADRGAAALALGLALGGKKVVLELPTTAHLARVTDGLAEAGRLAASEHRPTVVVLVPYGGELAAFDAPLGRALPPLDGVRAVCPSTAADAAGLLLDALNRPGVTVVLQPRALAERRGPVELAPTPATLRVLREGSHVTLAAWGHGVPAALAAAESLAAEGIQAEVVDLVAVQPVDTAALGAHVRATGRLVVAHPADDVIGDQVRAVGLDAAFLHLESPLAQVEADPNRIARAARDAVHY